MYISENKTKTQRGPLWASNLDFMLSKISLMCGSMNTVRHPSPPKRYVVKDTFCKQHKTVHWHPDYIS